MPQLSYRDLDHVYIDDSAWESDVAFRARQLFPENKITKVQSDANFKERGALSAGQFDRSKKQVLITDFKGQFFKRCPGAKPGLTCCNYFVMNLGEQCNMNCSYCYLQSFINSPVMKIYANIDSGLNELRSMGSDFEKQPLRVGTGEVIDSLSLDQLTLYSRKLITFFRDFPNWRLEFKSKSSYVDQFLDVEHANNVIVSFSINPQNIIENEEHGTASLQERLDAAEKALKKGFLLSFHLDPVIYHADWQNSYRNMVREVTARFRPEDILIMSLGALRFQPEQRHVMRERFGLGSYVLQGEMFPGRDGKWRYDQALREEMFEFILNEFREHSKEWKVFLCMETPETWLGAMKSMPKHVNGLEPFFMGIG
jgi:spore photoproduct lyase